MDGHFSTLVSIQTIPHLLIVWQTAAYNAQLPIVQYLLDIGANTEVADVGTRFVKLERYLVVNQLRVC